VKSSCTTNALSDLVVPAKDEEKSPLLGAQKTRPTTIEMAQTTIAEDDGVVRRDRSRALRARSPLLLHRRLHLPENGGRREDSTEPLLAQYAAALSASHDARGVARHGVRSHAMPGALVRETAARQAMVSPCRWIGQSP
jgi:hypothetical protein